MKPIIEYRTVYIRDDSLEKLEIAVNKLIKDGFQPFGGPCVTGKSEGGMIACQAMVRYKEGDS